MEDGLVQDATFLSGLQKFPDDGWLNYAAGYLHSKNWDGQKAYDAYDKVYKSDTGLEAHGAIQMIRLGRLLNDQGKDVSTEIQMEESQIFDYYASQVDGVDEGGIDNVYTQLYKGDVPTASSIAAQGGDDFASVKVLIGASDGAPDEMVETALDQNIDNLTDEAFVSFIGLKFRSDMSIEEHTQKIEGLFPEEEDVSVIEFIDAVKNANYTRAEQILKSSSLKTQGSLATLAYLMKGKRIPKLWTQLAKAVLYPSERPYIK